MRYSTDDARDLFRSFYPDSIDPTYRREYVLAPIYADVEDRFSVGDHFHRLIEVGLMVGSGRITTNRAPRFLTLELTDDGARWARRSLDDNAWTIAAPELDDILNPNH